MERPAYRRGDCQRPEALSRYGPYHCGTHGLEVVTTPLLRERDWGSFTGRFIPDLKGEVWPDDIETLENLLSRAGEFITYVKETFPGKKVLAVGHGIMNKAVQAVYYGKPMSEVKRMMNAEVRVLEL